MLQKFGKNQLAEHTMSHLKTWKILVKSLHLPAENSENLNFPDQDFDIFLPYSLNKKRRWEMDFMAEIQKIQSTSSENLTVLFLERTCTGPYQYLRYLETTLLGQFRIRAVHSISEDHFYRKTEINSIFGQDFQNFSEKMQEISENLENSGIVAYNFIEPPENFMKIFAKKCISKKNMDSPYTSGWIRKRRQKEIRKYLKFYEVIDFLDENFEEFGHEFSENNELFAETPRQKWYKLEDHLVENRVKNRA
ncbi:Sulfotransfer_1 domain-containing protein [Caenorhabditis elegans]|uniref:Sulfotransfer_1 domain-containing protein n=1 Tax=Caenorhabditis elegans TaxID=6239 RepID=O45909_CAEEL|nr:Sulfotransfer_1 domain-containing protein [Caenorhabditis elegans]CAA16298.2 Sulfotransfer_1 domain-containing protein [Caenorhabditis elegans]|eukprot:NP_507671.2 Uncharacterized protein CELE_Y17D7B.2 [Caenorhabditis elegans]